MARTESQLSAAEILVVESLQPIGSALQQIRVNAGATSLEYFTPTGGGQVDSVVAGTNISVDSTDPTAPIVSLSTSPALTGTPTAPTAGAGDSTTQIATTEFVQSAVRSVPSKEACKYATTAALPALVYNNGSSGVGATLTGISVGALSVDGNTPSVGDRILVKNQVSTFQNGIYRVTLVGSGITVFVLTRALDFNESQDIKTGASTYITSGTALGATTWDVISADDPVMGTDEITFVQVAGPGSLIAGNGISISGVTVAINTAVTADLTTEQTLTNKTLTSPVVNVTSDATGDIYYRNGSGLFTRLPIGSTDDVLKVTGGIPAWAASSGGGITTADAYIANRIFL